MMWLAYAKAGKELEAQEALAELGITAHCAKVVEVKRVGKRRKPDVFIEPLLPNYLFVECTPEQFLNAIAVKHMHSTMTVIPKGDATAVMRFVDKANAEFDARQAKIEAGERIEQFKPGDLLDVLDGRLAGLTATFRSIVEREGDAHPFISASVGEMMGKDILVSLDILDVRAAE